MQLYVSRLKFQSLFVDLFILWNLGFSWRY